MKFCNGCNKQKSLNAFHKDIRSKDGLYSKCKECKKLYQQQTKESFHRYAKNYRILNQANRHQYYLKNKEKFIKKIVEAEKIRYQTDNIFRLTKNLRRRIQLALKGKNKSQSTLELLGCSIENLKKHLEKQFKEGMNWSNHSVHGWHIDHIKPCASFDLSKPEEQAKCFHYTNLQPLWAEENQRKYDNYRGC